MRCAALCAQDGATPLHVACQCGMVDAAVALLVAGVAVDCSKLVGANSVFVYLGPITSPV